MERLFLLCSGLLVTLTSQHNVCSRPELQGNINMTGIQRFFSPGVELALSCKQGYTPVSGPRKIVCTMNGVWTNTKFNCIPKQCPYPELITNGELFYENTVYQSTINYTCHEGYTMTGFSSAVCQANGTWSTPEPECIPVSCGHAPVPLYGMVIYDQVVRGNTTNFGLTAMYVCNPPYALFGNKLAKCTASGTWTKAPECRVVTCPPPQNIERGYMSTNEKREFFYKEKVKYDCQSPYVLEGPMETVCLETGNWSEKPSCKGPCSVEIKRGRILYKGKKMWIQDFQPNRVLHQEIVSVYCMNKAMKCGYVVPTQCIDETLKIPECFEEPSKLDFTLKSNSLPSEIEQC
ncbi:beta-2-glycoprotein 1-like isoform X1 [Girardinichthys multiradiatus]|uniref:beta-2-glycoprotein 1-like isoform X1 n=1 Tax=Girardinichthys multiradiatus TaxID=208333 RepID=UPI001FAB4492|nr:beta-2-glycoprotein 1-like isoform X1 [Girardinichthys multiradiatus]